MKISVRAVYETQFTKEIAESIRVDNINIPQGMEINVDSENNKLIVEVSMEIKEPKNLLTLRNTLDEIFRDIITLQRTLNRVSK